MLRSVSARWFEAVVARPWLARALQCLASSGQVELDPAAADTAAPDIKRLQERFRASPLPGEKFATYLPQANFRELSPKRDLEQLLEDAFNALASWQARVTPHIERINILRNKILDLELLNKFLFQLRDDRELDFTQLKNAGPRLQVALALLDNDGPNVTELGLQKTQPLLLREVDTTDHRFLLTVGNTDAQTFLRRELEMQRGRFLELPKWLSGSAEESLRTVGRKLTNLQRRIETETGTIDTVSNELDIANRLGDALRLRWLGQHLADIPVTDRLGWITGWTSDIEGRQLDQALGNAGIPAVIHYPSPPPGKVAPTISSNPAWLRPFEFFSRLIGTPAHTEADPTSLVAVIAPLLFGYMFADVGQGAVLLIAGLALRRRWPMLAMLVPGGLSAIVFGLLFGSVFAMEHLLPAWWLHPIQNPIPVLLIPMFAGVFIISLGFVLSGFNAYWSGEGSRWILTDAGMLVAYAGLVYALVMLPDSILIGAGIFVAGLLWFVLGTILQHRETALNAFFRALGSFAEYILQLSVNSISFVRVGAFALAHAGLGIALISLAHSTRNTVVAIAILVIGNAAIVLLEGLVVFIQATRLILFEFFIRFLHGTGRSFRPTLSPQTQSGEGNEHKH